MSTTLFANPALLLAFYDPAFQSGQFRLYPWLVKFHQDFAARPDGSKKVNAVVINGGGKSSFAIAPGACWTASMFEQSQSAITSASNAQLDAQTMRSAKRLADNMNAYHQAELWDSQGRKMCFKPTGSMIDARKSDEEGLQEGFHQMVPGGEFSIFVDEAKTIQDDVYKGIMKWTGWTRWMNISSAGNPMGWFFRQVSDHRNKTYRVTIKDCPHISKKEYDEFVSQTSGEEDPLVRQTFYSEFAALAGSVVITLEDVLRNLRLAKSGAIAHVRAEQNEAGLDLSGGGDETVCSIRNGNKQIGLEICPFHKEDQIEEWVAVQVIPKWNLRMENIRADAGGSGRPMIRHIEAKVRKAGGNHGERMVMVYNQKAPKSVLKDNFGNRGTDMWYLVAAMIKDGSIILMDDPKQTTELSNRYYRKELRTDKIIVEPKMEAKAQGRPSPNRADSTVLCFENFGKGTQEEPKVERKKMSGEELEAFYDDLNEQRFIEPRHGIQVVTMDQVLQLNQMKGLMK